MLVCSSPHHKVWLLPRRECPALVLGVAAGVIGRRMKMEAFRPAIPEIAQTLGSSQQDGHRAAIAITTTGVFHPSPSSGMHSYARLPVAYTAQFTWVAKAWGKAD
jgi:hypothetical protein